MELGKIAKEKRKQSILKENNKQEETKLWNLNFFLLWQGKLVSAFGDTVYDIALGFWILAKTGSTGLMGLLMAASVLPRIFISPIAGTIVDKYDRKKILIITDLIRGIAISIVGVLSFANLLEAWIVLLAGIILGICGSFFNPAVSASIPDIVPRSKLLKANSAFSIVGTLNGVLGNAAGGFLYQILGAPIMFLTNGISYILSAGTELFVKIPKIKHVNKNNSFVEDMKSGLKFIAKHNGIKYLYIAIAFLNFFASMAIVLFLPLFNINEHLGPKMYGVAMSFSAAGMFIGLLILSVLNIKIKKSHLFNITGTLSSIFMILIPFANYFPIIAALFFLNGLMVAIINSLIQATMQMVVPQEMRGKVFGFRSTLSSALMPLAMASGGILAEFIPIKIVISGSSAILLILFVFLCFNTAVRKLMDFDPEQHSLEEIL